MKINILRPILSVTVCFCTANSIDAQEYTVQHFKSEKLKADSVCVRCSIEVPVKPGVPYMNVPVSFERIICYDNGKQKKFRWTVSIVKRRAGGYKDIISFSYFVYHSFLEYAEKQENMLSYSYSVPFFVHKTAAEEEEEDINDYIQFKRTRRADSMNVYRSAQGEFRLSLFANGQFKYTRATTGASYGGRWKFKNDTLLLESPYFESNPIDTWHIPFLFRYKYTDEQYFDRFRKDGNILYPIMANEIKSEPLLPYDSLADRRRFRTWHRKRP